MRTKIICFIFLIVQAILISSCTKQDKSNNGTGITTIVFKHGKIAGDPKPLNNIIKQFEAQNPNIKVKAETLPASTDEQHQYYVINLEGKTTDFDILSLDVIWTQEFAQAGWLKDITHLMPEDEKNNFFPGTIQAVTFKDKIHAIPWYIDAGLLYYRNDLLAKYNLSPPKTWNQLVETAQIIIKNEPDLYGFIWQGKQYEGLICNALEYMWSNGGDVIKDGEVVIDSEENLQALQFMKDIITKHKISPELVTTAMEEPSRHIFGQGKAVFMRNWPYAWNIFQKDDSMVKNKVGISTLPSFKGRKPASTLGGWQLGINKYSKNSEAAGKLIRFLTSPGVQKKLALSIGYKPTRMALYKDEDLLREQPFIGMLYDVFLHARPRPLSPYYMQITQVLQSEISAVLAGFKTPKEALETSQQQIEQNLFTNY